MTKKLCTGLLALLILIVIAMALGVPFGGEIVRQALEAEGSVLNGGTLSIKAVDGNPLRGYDLRGLNLADSQGTSVATVERLFARLDLVTLLAGRLRLAQVSLEGTQICEERVSHIIPQKGKASPSIELGQLDVHRIRSMSGLEWSVDRCQILREGQNWAISGDGAWKGLSVNAQLLVSTDEGALSVVSSSVRVLGGEMRLAGKLLPQLSVSGDLSLALKRMEMLLPSLCSMDVQGELSMDYGLTGNLEDPRLSGIVSGRSLAVLGLPVPDISGAVRIDKDTLTFVNWRGASGDVLISGDGRLSSSGLIQVNAHARNLGLDPWLDFMPLSEDLAASVRTLDLSLFGPFDALKGVVSMDVSRGTVRGIAFSDLKGFGRLQEGGAIEVSGALSLLGGTVALKGGLDAVSRDMDLNVTVRGVQADLLPTGLGIPEDLEGLVDADLHVQRIPTSPTITGNVTIRKPRAVGVAFSHATGTIQYDDGLIRLPSFTLSVADGVLVGAGRFRFSPELKTSFRGTVQGVQGAGLVRILPSLENLALKGSVDGRWTYRQIGSGSGRLTAKLKSQEINFVNVLPLARPHLDLVLNGDKLTVREGIASLYGGKLALSGDLFLKSGAMNFSGQLREMKSKELFQGLGDLEGEGIVDARFSLTGSVGAPKIHVSAQAPRIDVGFFPLENLSVRLDTDGDRLVSVMKGQLGGAPLTGGGWVRLSSGKKKGALDLEAMVDGLDIRGFMPKDVSMGGTVSGKLHLLGPLGRSKLYARAVAPRIQVGNVSFVSADLGGYLRRGDDVSFRASSLFGDRRIVASCDLVPQEGAWGIRFVASGKDVPLTALSPVLEGVGSGRVNLDLTGLWSRGRLNASGRGSSEEISIAGLHLRSVDIPLTLTEKKLRVMEGRAQVYGGKAVADLGVAFGRKTWKGRVSVVSADLAPLMRDCTDLSGSMAGSVDVRLDISGIAGRAFLMNIDGYLKGRSVEFRDFAVLKSVTKGVPLKIRDISANFNLSGNELFILPGGRASAWPHDPVFKYVAASGSVRWGNAVTSQKGEELDLLCVGEVNLKALNSFLGALKSILNASILDKIRDPRVLVSDLLGELVGGYSRNDFREVQLHLGGSREAPEVSELRIKDETPMGSSIPSLPGDSETTEPKIRIKVDIPTGEGGSQGDEAGDQVKDQILEGLIQQIVGGSDDP
ncbi:MAG: hypothetical protein CSA35_02445 [Dethiosulfovibrio peptidovorans]|nr:MAG: hypothetical protein CSA35_02445 [Dethiosulfovibrio peptidovorans]